VVNAARTEVGFVFTYSGTVAGVWRIPQAMLADWQARRLYANFHTAMHPGGEVRGQITPAR